MGTYTDKVRHYFRFNASELRGMVITILIVGFIWGFNDGADEFIFRSWFAHMILSILIAAVAILIKESTHKLVGLSAGYRVEFQMWWYGLLVALAICFVTRGYVPILITGGLMFHHIAIHRLGFFRYGTNTLDLGMISMMGPIGNIIFATIIKNIDLYLIPLGPIADEIFKFNMIFAVVNLLPMPPLVGSNFFFRTRLGYFFCFGFILFYVIGILFGVYSWFLGILGAILLWAGFFFFYERAAI